LDITAHFYNSSITWHGANQAVVNGKNLPEERRSAIVEDLERGYRTEVLPHPWQTDTCIGDWHYDRARFLNKTYMTAEAVVHRLCDTVAKNGCLLLSVPVRGDGTIDEEEHNIVESVGTWTQRYSEAIFSTRPWRLSGEGPTQVAAGNFGEMRMKPFEAADIRFTTRGGTLYAITLGRAQGEIQVKSLAGVGKVQRVEAVGSTGTLSFRHTADGLHVNIPDGLSHDYGMALRINGEGLV
jgi:alpha-L-fucosidase